jgi:nicotinate-nucleotide adenylyltransferase
MDRRMRIAVYGGTFDPVHYGHLAVAQSVVELFEIDQLLFVPARQAPHKLEREVTPPIHRYAMLALATQADERLLVSTVELEAPERRYTIETLGHFKSEFGEAVELFFVMGADSWAEITTWREWRKLVQLTNQIVVTRPGYELKLDAHDETGSSIIDVRGMNAQQVSKVTTETEGARIYVSDAAMVDVSATDIREAANSGQHEELKAFVPAAVADYIIKYELYKNSNEN